MEQKFSLHARLAADSVFICRLELCEARLMDERRWPWLLLVPRRAGAEEVFDLSQAEQAQLMAETGFAAKILRASAAGLACGFARCDKINIGALGNSVRQLHMHIVARAEGDAAWPGPVWGQGARQPLEERQKAACAARLGAELAKMPA